MVTIRPATSGDAVIVGKLMADAFRDDPAWAVTYPKASTRYSKLETHYRRRVQRHPELGDVAVDDGRIVGALLFAVPRTPSGASSALGSVSRLIRTLASRLPGRNGLAHTLAIEKHLPPEPHWYLHDVAASPQARGKGVGTALLSHRLGVIDDAGERPGQGAGDEAGTRSGTSLTALEATTEGSRRLYERFGFEAVSQIPTGPGQASTIMVRRPASPMNTRRNSEAG